MFENINANFLYNQYLKSSDLKAEVDKQIKPRLTVAKVKARCGEIQYLIKNLLSEAFRHLDEGQVILDVNAACALRDRHFVASTTTFLKKLYQIDFNITQNGGEDLDHQTYQYYLSWKKDNKSFSLKPVLKPQPNHAIPAVFAKLFQNFDKADVFFSVENQCIPGHKAVLSQNYYFAELFIKYGKSEKIVFENCSESTFCAALEYFYKGNIDQKYVAIVQNCLDLYRLGLRIKCSSLQELAKTHIFDQIDDKSFVDIALQLEDIPDPDLSQLCEWFAKTHLTLGSNYNISAMKIMTMVKVYQIGKKYKAEFLVNNAAKTISSEMKLNEDFIELCKKASANKDVDLKGVITNALKNNQELFQSMISGKKETYKEHWIAYKRLVTDINLQ